MKKVKQKRIRGLIFSTEGWQKVHERKKRWEKKNKSGIKCTLEDLSEITGLAYNTVLKITERRRGVDKRSLVKFSMAFGIELTPDDYMSPRSLEGDSKKKASRNIDWDKPIRLPCFYGRTSELAVLTKWLVGDRCRLVTVQGLGGSGKTSLCVSLLKQIKNDFDYVIWRSLKDRKPLKELLIDLLQSLCSRHVQQSTLAESNISTLLTQLINCLRLHRCLIVFDDLDKIMSPGQICGSYKQTHQDYAPLIRYLGESFHKSCLLLITREKSQEVAFMEGEDLPVRFLKLNGLASSAARKILLAAKLVGSEAEQNRLIQQYSGHSLVLTLVSQKINREFEGKISRFLQQDNFRHDDLSKLWDDHIERLSGLELEILDIIANFSESASFLKLRKHISLSVSSHEIIDALGSLARRSLLVTQAEFFSIDPLILTYLINNS